MNTAERVYQDIITMPVDERARLFAIIARKGFEKDTYTYDEVFDDIPQTFTVREAAEYLEVAEITVRRWAKEGKLLFRKVGRNFVFQVDDLRKKKHGPKGTITG